MRESKLSEPLSQDELQVMKSTAERNAKLENRMAFVVIVLAIISLLAALATVAILFYMTVFGYTPHIWISVAIIAICVTVAVFYRIKFNSLSPLDPSDFDSIDADPEACQNIKLWMSHEAVNKYVSKIAAQGRLPANIEYQAIKEFIENVEEHEPVNALRKTLNLEIA